MSKKKLKLYMSFGESRTIIRVKPEQHPLLVKFIAKNYQIIEQKHKELNSIKGVVIKIPSYTLDNEGYNQLKKELKTSKEKILIYYSTTSKPLVELKQEVNV